MLTRWTLPIHWISSRTALKAVGLLVSAALIVGCCFVLWRILDGLDSAKVLASVHAVPPLNLAATIAFVACAYALIGVYDIFALRTIGADQVPYRIAALAGPVAFAIGHNLGATAFTAGAVRYRFYSGWGLSVIDVAKICFVTGLTFWLGNFTAIGLGMLLVPEASAAIDQLPLWLNRVFGAAALMALISWLVWVWRQPRRIGRDGWSLVLPGGPRTFLQIVIGLTDLTCSSMAMYMLLPAEPAIGVAFLAVVIISATLLGFASHAPGSIGVFDAAILIALPMFDREGLVATLLLYRLCYFIGPFALAAIALSVYLWLSVGAARSSRSP